MKKKEILSAVLSLFIQRGYENTSMQDIADKVNIKKPSLYHHFKSKSEIFEKILIEEFINYIDNLERNLKIIDSQTIEEALSKLYFESVKYYNSDHLIFWTRVRLMATNCNEEKLVQSIKHILQQMTAKISNEIYILIDSLCQNSVDLKTKENIALAFFQLNLQTSIWRQQNISDDEALGIAKDQWKSFWNGAGSVFMTIT